MPEKIGGFDPKKEYIEAKLYDTANSYISSLLTSFKLQEMGAPAFLVEDAVESRKNREKQIIICAEALGEDPKIAVVSRVQELLQQFREGNFQTGTYMARFNREDIATLEELLLDPEEKGLVLSHTFAEEERAQYEAWLEESWKAQEERKIDDIAERFYFLGKWRKMGDSVGMEDVEDPDLVNNEIVIPLIGGKTIEISVSPCGEVSPPLEQENILDFTYPAYNAVFHYNPISQANSESRVISLPAHSQESREELYHSSGLYSENFDPESGSYTLHAIDPNLRDDMRNIISEDMRLTEEDLKTVSVAKVLARIHCFIRDNSSGEDAEPILKSLLDHYKEEKTFPGDCKSIATLVIGFGESLGIPGRMLSGSIYGGGGHAWAEQYVPMIDSWVPNDPAMGAFYTYPDDEDIYLLDSEFNPAQNMRLKVTSE